MKARDQNRTGFTVESGCEEGCNIGKIQAPRRSWSITPAIKMRELLDWEKITLSPRSKISKFSLFPTIISYGAVLYGTVPQVPARTFVEGPKAHRRGQRWWGRLHSSLVPSGHKWWGCGGPEGLGLLLSSQMKLLQKLSSFLDNLPPLHAVQPPLSQSALHTEVCKKTGTDLIIYPRYFYGKTLRVMNLA